MNEYTRNLVKCICRDGSNKNILFYTKQLLLSDKTAKDESFRRNMLSEINKKEQNINVPPNCAMFTVLEEPAKININRYLLTDSEKDIYFHIEKMHKVSKILLEKEINHKNAMIFYGESGTGKTMFGRYIAYKLNLPFIYINFAYLMDSLLGKTQQNISNIFRFVNGLECVFMIDELDSIATKRGASNDVSEISRITITLMQEIDNMSGNVILLGATNKIKNVDEAVISRFGGCREIKRFSAVERENYAKNYLNDVGMEYTEHDIETLIKDDLPQRILENNVINYIASKIYKEINQ